MAWFVQTLISIDSALNLNINLNLCFVQFMINSTVCQILFRLPCLTKPRLCFINKLMHLQTQKIYYLSCAWCSDVIHRTNVFICSLLLVIGVPDIMVYSPFFLAWMTSNLILSAKDQPAPKWSVIASRQSQMLQRISPD